MAIEGTVIDGKYEILKLIGKGGMSKVYLAMDKRLNKQWAVKEIQKNARDKNNQVVIQSAIAEANMIKRLDHPALPRIVDIIDNGTVIYIIMDYIEGETLSSVLNNYGAQPQEQVIEWAMQLCGVLDYLHTCTPPIIYRDMKPDNVMLKPDGTLKLIDFGIAREYKQQNLADTVNLGTKGYAAPEQFGGKGQTDARTDVYCLGVTLYHLVTGMNPCEPPYEICPIRNWNPQLSGGLEKIIQKCTQLNPEDRYQSCAELMYALEHYEEVDDIYLNKQRSKLRKFILVTALSAVFLGAGIFTNGMKNKTNNEDYSNLILQADKASTTDSKIDLYLDAINIKPYTTEAYLGLINAFKEDAEFTVEEEAELRDKLNPHLKTIRKHNDYADLAFEIGKIYWYYYDYGKEDGSDNQLTRMKSAIQWFDDAVNYGDKSKDYYQMATIYRDIGKFNRDITIDVTEGSEKGKYGDYYKRIKELVDLVKENQSEAEIVKLELYKLTLYSIENYVKNFKASGITEDDIQGLFDIVKKEASDISANAEVTEQIQKEILGRTDSIQLSIKTTYEKEN